ncbi:endo-beta-N-acetylglucosaminidase [Erysipelothrix sp. HDW6A]|uniref:glucosaminidase domain-containing protein n=1 Tax=Erysipelothrix sp. HDW6A TaxID=2714928 RepID=UPI00140C439F|nr:glucosaminidase domain-containing protein [Erysipelothrix sp. HDW6A]QIK57580.1 endo-beta-N-acetylglucosaminidase [Erysipelothrix sp. HDW6A]
MKLNKSKIKVLSISVLTMLVVSLFSSQFMVRAEDDEPNATTITTDKAGEVTILDIDTSENTEVVYLDPIVAEEPITAIGGEGLTQEVFRIIEKSGTQTGILRPNKPMSLTMNVYSSSIGGNVLSYISGSIAYNGVFPFYKHENKRYLITIAGLEGWVDEANFDAYSMDEVANETVTAVNHYQVNSDGNLIHYIAQTHTGQNPGYSPINNGPAPTYLKKGIKYYSNDGHYFYSKIASMNLDYSMGQREGAINAGSPYYNYYQFLSYRAPSQITAANLDAYATNKKGYTERPVVGQTLKANQSQLFNLGNSFIDNAKRYGLNPLLTYGIAINESAWGRSNIAIKYNNLFGHAAYDSYPEGANGYPSVENSIHYHNQRFMNWLYLDPTNFAYYGGFVGDKQAGMNVKYASDPFWGEKAAQFYYELDRAYNNVDYNKQTLAVSNYENVPVYREKDSKSKVAYKLNRKDLSVLIMSIEEGEMHNNSKIWYKIASDPVLEDDRTLMDVKPGNAHREAYYDMNKHYFYVHSSDLTIISNGKGIGQMPEGEVKPQGKKGDLNNDGLINISDMMVIRRHILNIKPLTGFDLIDADLNNDGQLNISDMMVIRRHILGIKPID